MRLNCNSIAKHQEQTISYPSSRFGKGNVRSRKGKSIDNATPKSPRHSGGIQAIICNGEIVSWIPA